MDDKPTEYTLSGTGSGTFSTEKLKAGKHSLSIKARQADGGEIFSDPLTIEIAAHARMMPLDNGNIVDLRKLIPAEGVSARIEIDPALSPRSVQYFLDDLLLLEAKSPPFDTIKFRPDNLASGSHTLHALVMADNGKRFSTADLVFEVMRDAKKEFLEWRTRVNKMFEGVEGLIGSADKLMTFDAGNISERIVMGKALQNTLATLMETVAKLRVPRSISGADKETLLQALALFVDAVKAGQQAAVVATGYVEYLQRAVARYGRTLPQDVALQLTRYTSEFKRAYQNYGHFYRRGMANLSLVYEHLQEEKK